MKKLDFKNMRYNSGISFQSRMILTCINMLFFVMIVVLALVMFFLSSQLNFISYLGEFEIPESISFFIIMTLILFPIALFLNQDNVNSCGIVKRLMGLQIVSNKTDLPASNLKCLVSNFSFFFLQFDFFIWIMTPDRGIGDYIVGTKVISTNQSSHNSTVYNMKGYLRYIISSLIISSLVSSVFLVIVSFITLPVSESALYKVEQLNDSTEINRKYFDQGNLNIEYTMVNGKYNGFYKEWDEQGNLKNSIEYKQGIRNGITTTYYPNGVKESETLYLNNELVKTINMWDTQGNKIVINE